MSSSNSPERVEHRNSPSPRSPNSPSPSPRPTGSLQAAATVNAGLQLDTSRTSPSSGSLRNRQSPHHGRRRSSVLMQLQLTDPTLPPPGEMVTDSPTSGHVTTSPLQAPRSPRSLIHDREPLHHARTPSLGELHQNLEAETEAHVNRLLHVIQQQQVQLQQLQGQGSGQPSPGTGDETTPPSVFPGLPIANSQPRSPVQPRSSFDMARADLLQRRSRTPSRGQSPRLRSTSISGESGEPLNLPGRDESAFYQAETQMLTRENQMLRHRIRELEQQLTGLGVGGHGPNSSFTHEPFQHSHLTQSTSAGEESSAGGTRSSF